MLIYGALFVPILAVFILYYFFKRKMVWWEFLIPLAVSFVLVVSMKLIIEKVQVTSKEYWGSLVDHVEYYEEWNEYIHQTCTKSCCCDSKGENCSTETYDCSYVQYHAPYWQIITTTNEVVRITEAQYQAIKKQYGNEQKIDLHRNYWTIDGDEFISYWAKDSANAISVTTLHTYENRIKAADQSVFHFLPVAPEDVKKYDLKQYPAITDNYNMVSILGDNSDDALAADRKIKYLNGLLGPKKQVKVFVLVFQNQPVDAALYQEWLWSGGNKNEFVVCVGIDKQRNVKWCKTISWTTSELLKVNVKSFVQKQRKLDLQALAYYMQVQIDKQFVRRQFKEFSYLTVEPPLWAVLLTYGLTIAGCFGVSFWLVNNEYGEDSYSGSLYGARIKRRKW